MMTPFLGRREEEGTGPGEAYALHKVALFIVLLCNCRPLLYISKNNCVLDWAPVSGPSWELHREGLLGDTLGGVPVRG